MGRSNVLFVNESQSYQTSEHLLTSPNQRSDASSLPSKSRTRQSWRSEFGAIAAIALAYFTSGWLLLGGLEGNAQYASPVWFPAGIAIAALLLGGIRWLPGVWLGDLLLLQGLGLSGFDVIVAAIGTTVAALMAIALLNCLDFDPSFQRLRDLAYFVGFAAFLSPLANSSIDPLVLWWFGKIDLAEIGTHGSLLWLGDATGIMAIAPLILTIGRGNSTSVPLFRRRSLQRIAELLGCFGGLALSSGWVLASSLDFAYVPLAFVVWAALRFDRLGVGVASLMLGTMAAWSGWGAELTSDEHLIAMQAFVLFSVIVGWLVAIAPRQSQHQSGVLESHADGVETYRRALLETALRIRQPWELDDIFETTVTQVRQLFGADRAYIACLNADGTGTVVAESVGSRQSPIVSDRLDPLLFREMHQSSSRCGDGIRAIDNTSQLDALRECRQVYYCQLYGIEATLTVPLMQNNQLFGLLVLHQCDRPRHWQPHEIDGLKQLAVQVTISIHQARLYRQAIARGNALERQVAKQTAQLGEKMQEVKELYGLKDVVLQGISHDLRTSLMGMLMILQNAANRCVSTASPAPSGTSIALARSAIERMIQSAKRQLTLIDALSQDLDSAEQPVSLQCQRVSLVGLVEEAIAHWQPTIVQNQAVLRNFIPADFPAIAADPSKLQHVFEHCIGNALVHNPPGVSLTLEAHLDGEMVCIRIRDTGVGMTSQQCDNLFKLYIRGRHCQHLTGIGLGSYLCRQIIAAHGGQIGVESHPGNGTTVWFTLPIATARAAS